MAIDKVDKRILIVEDTVVNLELIVQALQQYKLSVARSGEEALKYDFEAHKPDLILLDVEMPGISGYEVCKVLKKNPETQHIPIMFLSARDSNMDEAYGLELGAVDYVKKPFSLSVLQARVKTQLDFSSASVKLQELSKKLARYLPSQFYESIFSGSRDAKLVTHRKKLTTFFSDIVGFTARVDTMETEDFTYIMNSYLDSMAKLVLKFGGTLDKFIGDAIVVFFGDPESNGIREDALACVEMAIEMQKEMKRLRVKWRSRGLDGEIEVRMGLCTGYCTVGNFGCEERMDYTAVGNNMNMSARLQEVAGAGEILISQETWSLVRSEVYCIKVDPVELKGFAYPVQCYQVVDLYENLVNRIHIDESFAGFNLFFEPEIISGEKREEVVNALRTALDLLGEEESPDKVPDKVPGEDPDEEK